MQNHNKKLYLSHLACLQINRYIWADRENTRLFRLVHQPFLQPKNVKNEHVLRPPCHRPVESSTISESKCASGKERGYLMRVYDEIIPVQGVVGLFLAEARKRQVFRLIL
jgi:hypothetical protein